MERLLGLLVSGRSDRRVGTAGNSDGLAHGTTSVVGGGHRGRSSSSISDSSATSLVPLSPSSAIDRRELIKFLLEKAQEDAIGIKRQRSASSIILQDLFARHGLANTIAQNYSARSIQAMVSMHSIVADAMSVNKTALARSTLEYGVSNNTGLPIYSNQLQNSAAGQQNTNILHLSPPTLPVVNGRAASTVATAAVNINNMGMNMDVLALAATRVLEQDSSQGFSVTAAENSSIVGMSMSSSESPDAVDMFPPDDAGEIHHEDYSAVHRQNGLKSNNVLTMHGRGEVGGGAGIESIQRHQTLSSTQSGHPLIRASELPHENDDTVADVSEKSPIDLMASAISIKSREQSLGRVPKGQSCICDTCGDEAFKSRCGNCLHWRGGKRPLSKTPRSSAGDGEDGIFRNEDWTCCGILNSAKQGQCTKCHGWRGGKRIVLTSSKGCVQVPGERLRWKCGKCHRSNPGSKRRCDGCHTWNETVQSTASEAMSFVGGNDHDTPYPRDTTGTIHQCLPLLVQHTEPQHEKLLVEASEFSQKYPSEPIPHHLQTTSTIGEKIPGSISNIDHAVSPSASGGRKVGRIRHYNEQNKTYGAWQDICVSNLSPSDGSLRIDLSRGGKVGLYTKMLPPGKQKSLSAAMHQCKLYRQYTRSQVFNEPRFHVLLSSNAHADAGYMYHGIKMKSLPIDLVPDVASYAEELARWYKLPGDQWNIGVDLIVYKDGQDSIGWHADDTQGESVVLCVVVDAPGEPRPVYIRPNKRMQQLKDGDEEVQLDVGEGMAYDMDGIMQAGYEHSLPKKRDDKSHRFVLIFRHGDEAAVPQDSGRAITEMAAAMPKMDHENLISLISRLRVKPPLVAFGHSEGIVEGSYYSRRYLYAVNAHRADQKGVNGNMVLGSDSIVVSRQSLEKREEDGLQWLRYTSSRRQGGGAICLSHSKKLPLRVFRSSNLKTEYAPPELEGNRTSYRYDGLYIVTNVWDADGNSVGNEAHVEIPVGGFQFTFHLERLPKRDTSSAANGEVRNSMNVDDLWGAIQSSHGRQPTVQFEPPCPKCNGALPKLLNDIATTGVPKRHEQSSLPAASIFPFDMAVATVQSTKPEEGYIEQWKTYQGEHLLASLLFPSFWDRNHSSGPRLSRPTEFGDNYYHLSRIGHPYQPPQLLLPSASMRLHSPEATPRFQSHPSPGHPPNDRSQSNHKSNAAPTETIDYNQPSAMSPSDLSIAPIENEHGSSSQGVNIEGIDREQWEKKIDFTNPKSIMLNFSYHPGKGRLRPLISDIKKLKTDGEKMQYIYDWRNLSKDQQENYKKNKRNEKEALDEAKKEQKKKKKRTHALLQAAKRVRSTRGALQELDTFAHSILLGEHWKIELEESKKDRKKRTKALLQASKRMKSTRGALQELDTFAHSIVLVECWKSSIALTENAIQELDTFAHSIVLGEYWKDSIAVTGNAVCALESFASSSLVAICGNKMRRNKSQAKTQPAKKPLKKPITMDTPKLIPKAGSVVKKEALQEQAKSRDQKLLGRIKWPRLRPPEPAKLVEPCRKVLPRFISIEQGSMQSLSQPMEAVCRYRGQKLKMMKVTIKWAIAGGTQEQRMCNVDNGVLSGLPSEGVEKRKSPDAKIRNSDGKRFLTSEVKAVPNEEVGRRQKQVFPTSSAHEEGPVSDKAVEHNHRRKSPRLSNWGLDTACESNVKDECNERSLTAEVEPVSIEYQTKQNIRKVDVAKQSAKVRCGADNKSQTPNPFCVNERIFAWDNYHLYKANVLKYEILKGSIKYFVRYLEFGKSHDRWLSARDMIKDSPSSREFYEDCITWRLENDQDIQTCGSQKRARQKESARGVPKLGMKVNVKFDDKFHAGRITKVALQSEEQASDKASYTIQICYDDGDIEDTTFPDADIHLGPDDCAAREEMTRSRKRKNRESHAAFTNVSKERSLPPPQAMSRNTSNREASQVGKFLSKEKLYAWDRGVLYEAKVLECKDVRNDAIYHVRYLGYKKCHDRWLTSKDLMKMTPRNHQFYLQSRGPPPEVGMRVSVKFERGKLYGGKLTEVKKKVSEHTIYHIRVHYDDGEIEDATYPDPEISLGLSKQLPGKRYHRRN